MTLLLIGAGMLIGTSGCQSGARGGGGGGGGGGEDAGDEAGGEAGDNLGDDGEGAGGDAPQDVMATGRVEGELNGYFEPDEFWFFVHEGGIIAGYGDRTFFAAVLAAPGFAKDCFGFEPAVSISAVGDQLEVNTTFLDAADGRVCSTSFRSNLGECSDPSSIFPGSFCQLENATGSFSQTGVGEGYEGEYPLGEAYVSLLGTCDTSSFELDATNEAFALVNLNPLALAYIKDPSSFEGLVLIGSDGTQSAAAVVSEILSEDTFVGCGTENLNGNVSLEGDRLTVDYTLDNELGRSEGVSESMGCTVHFEGQATLCLSVPDAPSFVQFTGTGFYTTDDQSHDMPELYLLLGGLGEVGPQVPPVKR